MTGLKPCQRNNEKARQNKWSDELQSYNQFTVLSEQVNITTENLSILKTGKAKANKFCTLEIICKELQWLQGDILEWVDEK